LEPKHRAIIPFKFLDCSLYLYPTVAAAQAGEHTGGSGCVVAVPLHNDPDTDVATVYAVTNSHVVRSEQGGSTVVRVNRKDGGFDALPLDPDSWIHHGDGADIAVAPMTLDEGTHRYTSIGPWTFVTPEQPMWFGVGADTVMVGRFVTHEGRQRNIPAARFGNVSVLPYEPVRVGLGGLAQERFLVEEHSFSGYSGSPVFVYHQLLPEDVPTVDPDARALEQPPYLMGMAVKLLGINWGHLRDYEDVRQADGTRTSEGLRVYRNTGMAAVVPAWKLHELLYDDDEVVAVRDKMERAWLDTHEDEAGRERG